MVGRRNLSIALALLLLLVAIAFTPQIHFNMMRPKHLPYRSILTPPDRTLIEHINKTLAYIYRNIHPDTHLAYSFTGDWRLRYWSVTYDNAMRAIVHVQTGDIKMAKKTINYFIENTAIQKIGYVYKDGKLVKRPGWVINIVDASEPRHGGRGIEHIAHVGPNAFLGIASLHLFLATNEKKYLDFARNRWVLIKDLQNENPDDFNYGGVRMGPMGDPANPQEQRLDFNPDNPSYYDLYNAEHAADFLALTKLLDQIDANNGEEYARAARLIGLWDRKIFDYNNHLFYIGTTEKKFFEPNIGRWVGPGVIPMRPLDASALKICAYGIEDLNQIEPDAAEKIRAAIDRHFKVSVKTTMEGKKTFITGYDFISDMDRSRLVLFEEEGPMGDVKVKKGIGRKPLLSDEWSTWVAFADLRMAKDFQTLRQEAKSKSSLDAYTANARMEALRTGDALDDRTIAYPYTHPMPEGFNKPVGFGWNTHHAPYSMIGGVSRIVGIMGADPFCLDHQSIFLKADLKTYRLADRTKETAHEGLVTEAEVYINEAWIYVRAAQKKDLTEKENWEKAAAVVEKMMLAHPDWAKIAAIQNEMAKKSSNQFPLLGMGQVTEEDLEPVYRKYWALYHVGTGEFIRVMAYSQLARLAKEKKELDQVAGYQEKARMAAEKILLKYTYAQAYDQSGWLWQPVDSLREYIEDYDEKFPHI